jgi:hypothetical protein
LVEQRPDIQSAEAQLHAASALIGVAVAAQLPQFTLTANAGTVANQIGQLFITPGTAFWSVAGNVAQTIFDAGTLLHKKRAADAAFDQAAAMYRSTVITAFQNVADALHALQSDAETLKAAYAAERAAFKSLEIAHRQLQLGAIGYLGLLTTQNTYQTALVALVQAQAARYADTAALFQALGGGWWNREDVPPQKAWDIQLLNKQPRHPPALRSRPGLRISAHRLRKLGARRFAEAGASEHQLMALFGWTNPHQAAVYTKKADRTRLEASAAPPFEARGSNKCVPLFPAWSSVGQSGRKVVKLSVEFFER